MVAIHYERYSNGACFYFVGPLFILILTASGNHLSSSDQSSSSEESDVTYKVFQEDSAATWSRAGDTCRSIGMVLVEITSADELTALPLASDDDSGDVIARSTMVWTGLSTDNTDCTGYRWNGVTPVGNWIPWAQNEPDNCDTDKCIVLVGDKFRTNACNRKAAFICQRKEGTTLVPTTVVTDFTLETTTDALSNSTMSGNTTCLCDPKYNFRTGLMTSSQEDMRQRVALGFVPTCNTEVIIKWDTPQNLTQAELETLMALLAELQEKLLVMKNTTTTAQRKLISAADSRTSASTLGAVGVSLLIIEVLFVIVVDFSRVFMKC